MGNRIKLTEPGSSHTFRVTAVELNKSGKWPDYDLSDGTDIVSIPQKAADRQVARLKVASISELLGAWVKVSRSTETGDNGKYFWNLDIVNAPAAPSKRIQPPPIPPKGKPLPFDEGWDPSEDRGHVGMSAPPNAPLHGEEEEPSALDAKSQGEAIQRRALEEAYGDLFARCATRQLAIGQGAEIPFDLASVNSMASTIWISWKDAGLTRGIASDALARAAEGGE